MAAILKIKNLKDPARHSNSTLGSMSRGSGHDNDTFVRLCLKGLKCKPSPDDYYEIAVASKAIEKANMDYQDGQQL